MRTADKHSLWHPQHSARANVLLTKFNLPFNASDLQRDPSLLADAALTQSKDGWRPNGMGDLTGHFMPATFGDQMPGAQQVTQQAQEPLFGLHGGTNGFLQDNWIPNLDFTGLGLAPELEYASKLAPGPEGLLADHNFFQHGQGEPNVATADLSRLQQSHPNP